MLEPSMNCLRQWIRTGGALAVVVLAPACGGGGGTEPPPPPPPPTVAAVVITSPASAPVFGALGRTVQFAAQPKDASGNVVPGKTLTWASSNTAVATVSGLGLVTAAGNGPATISASVDTKTGFLGVTVAQVTNSVVVVTPGTVAFGAKGSTRQLTAEARDSTNNVIAGKTFTWASMNAAVATVSATGLVTSVADGTTQISASVDGQSGNVSVTVAIIVTQVVVTPGSKTFSAAGSQQRFTAVANDSNANAIAGKTFTWSSTNAAVVTVDANGLATSAGNGTAQVQATADAKTGGASVTVDIVVASLTLSPTSRTFTRINQSQTFTPTARDANNNVIASPTLTWVSRNTSFVTVNSSGTATSVADGSTYVVATTTSGVKDSALVAVSAVADAVSVSPSSVAFGAIASTRQLTATVLDSGGTAIPGRTVTWSGTNRGAATVNASGLVTATAVGADTAIATPAGPANANVGRAPISVIQVVKTITVTSTITRPDTFFTTGRQRQFSAAAADSFGNAIPGATFTWSSTSTSVATVDATGFVTAVADGTASIQATSGTVMGSRSVVVRRFASVFTLFPTTPPTLTTAGGTQVFNGTAQDSSGANLLITWLSSSTSVATVSPASGTSTTATAVANGTTQIVMSGGTRTASATLTVNIPVTISFSSQVQPIFTASCALSGCHTGSSPTGSMNLSTGVSRSQLVNVAAVGFAGAIRVIPGDANNSYLIRKLENGPNISGLQMPENRAPLSQATINIIRDWISQGAQNN